MKKPQSKTKGSERTDYVCQHVLTKVESQVVEETKVGNMSLQKIFYLIYMLHYLLNKRLLMIAVNDLACVSMQSAKHHLFHDETLPSFFRRLSWSPDGSFLLVPAGKRLHI